MSHIILQGDCIEMLRTLPDASVHCCMTSPPYWGLRDYGHGGQIGLEETPEKFVERLVAVFREVRRVLREDGTCWVNLGDSYASSPRGNKNGWEGSGLNGIQSATYQAKLNGGTAKSMDKTKVDGLKPKDLVGIPWRVAFALQADGWWLRQDIIWHKPSPMPESVTDRCTKAHEYVFLLTKSQNYFFDAEAIKEESVHKPAQREVVVNEDGRKAVRSDIESRHRSSINGGQSLQSSPDGTRNRRSVWKIASRPYKGAHFATMPPELAETCIKAGSSERGCCPHCGSPWQRVTKKTRLKRKRPNEYVKRTGEAGTGSSCSNTVAGVAVETLGWQQTCKCEKHEPVPCVVLDPFGGSGTTSAVAKTLGRNSIYVELNPDYIELARKRIDEAGAAVKKKQKPAAKQMEMFVN